MPNNIKAMPNNNRVMPNNTITIILADMAPHTTCSLSGSDCLQAKQNATKRFIPDECRLHSRKNSEITCHCKHRHTASAKFE